VQSRVRRAVIDKSLTRGDPVTSLPRLAFNEKLCEARWRKRARSGRQVSATSETMLAAAGIPTPTPPPFGGCTVGKSGRSSRVFPRQSRRPQERAIPNKPNREGKLVSSGFLERACACARLKFAEQLCGNVSSLFVPS